MCFTPQKPNQEQRQHSSCSKKPYTLHMFDFNEMLKCLHVLSLSNKLIN